MTQIKYRAIGINTEKWVYGVPFKDGDKIFMINRVKYSDLTNDDTIFAGNLIYGDTLSRCIELLDINKKEIYEGDIFKPITNSQGDLLEVPILEWWGYEGTFMIKCGKTNRYEYLSFYESDTELEIISDIQYSKIN